MAMNPILLQYIPVHFFSHLRRFFSFILDLVRSNFHTYQPENTAYRASGVVYVLGLAGQSPWFWSKLSGLYKDVFFFYIYTLW